MCKAGLVTGWLLFVRTWVWPPLKRVANLWKIGNPALNIERYLHNEKAII